MPGSFSFFEIRFYVTQTVFKFCVAEDDPVYSELGVEPGALCKLDNHSTK